MKKSLLFLSAMAAAGATGAFAQEGVTQDSVLKTNDTIPATTIVKQTTDLTSDKIAKTMTLEEATRFMESNTNEREGLGIEPDPEIEGEGVGIEPDPVGGDSEELEPTDGGPDKIEKESPVKFTISTGVGYTIGGKPFMSNRISGSGTLFKGTKGETRAFAYIDYDDPMHSKGSGKLSLGKTIYKGLSLEGDYTFTGTGGNSVRVGLGYGGKLGNGQYAINIYPLNSSKSPITAKVSFSTPVGKNGFLSSFVNVDLSEAKNLGYYTETKYSHDISNLINGVALFAQLRVLGDLDFQLTDKDIPSFRLGFDINVK